MPQAQAYSRFGYRKNAVLPTPEAPIIRQWTSSLSTSARISRCSSIIFLTFERAFDFFFVFRFPSTERRSFSSSLREVFSRISPSLLWFLPPTLPRTSPCSVGSSSLLRQRRGRNGTVRYVLLISLALPTGCAVLTVANGFALEIVERIILGEEGHHEQECQQSAAKQNQGPYIFVHASFSFFSNLAQRSSFQSLRTG